MTPLRVGYTNGDQGDDVLCHGELRIERGDRVALLGDNGSGKTTP